MSGTADQSQGEVRTYYCDCPAEAQDENLCDTCNQLNLDELLDCNTVALLRNPKTVFRLGHIAGSRCAFCQFLRACLPQGTLDTEDVLNIFSLEVYRALPIFRAEGLGLAEVPALQIYEQIPYSLGSQLAFGSRSILPVHEAPTIAGRHVKNEADVSMIAGWLEICHDLHPQCKHDSRQPIRDVIPGLQFIDCHTMKVVPATAASTEYATLSYVWGSHLNVATYAPNETIDMMPKVIEDTALLVRKLGIRYLWVDRYCIPQNDTAAKHRQIQSMGDIYGQSMLTVISAAGSDPSQGLPGVTSVSRKPYPEIRLDCISVPHRILRSPTGVYYKRLDFGKAFPSSLELRDPHTVLRLIHNYRKRDLSFDDDALHAMAGIFAAFRKLKQPVQFVCGLPIFYNELLRADTRQFALLQSLPWDGTALRRRPQFPSWTWLGWKSEESSGFAPQFSYLHFLPLEKAQSHDKLFSDISAKFEYRDGTVLDWETSYASVLELDSQSHHPTRLRLAGWTFHVQIPSMLPLET
ncbi:HET-domain-containing [Fusarium albosuccineum]|uniref:HET-domain-containing n=1 Tax=Fusarium albosuccineum TaxID=1237068 RepID=A0A8H4LNS8_9HYPO|nr:HET-domain-containing [Fusarium albosuccineum]